MHFTRSNTKIWLLDNPIGDPLIGGHRGFKCDPMTAMAAATVGSALIGSNAAQSAADTQAQAANNASAQQMAMFNKTNAQQQPWIQQGTTAINQMGNMTAPGSAYMTPMTNADLNANLAPNYQFQLDQGLGALKNQQNATGGLVSGNSMKAINDYAQNFAGNAYQNAFNNYNTSQTNIFNRLASIAGVGQTSANNNQVAGMNAANMAGNYATSGAAAQAAGQVGAANAISGGMNNMVGYNTLSGIMNGGGMYSPVGNNSPTNMTGFQSPVQTFGASPSSGISLIPGQ